jgi:hypothetical protein
VFWDEAARYPGSTQLGLAKELLAGLPFEKLGRVQPDRDATWRAPALRFLQDWVLLLKTSS